eukprot:GDKI01001685.1.p1 GENE.GDKI01001685.1~~GDKI01001685.1.p1  ORF type:complete len:408 (-),score=118.66 GDKI01001685.1:13-1182(-)
MQQETAAESMDSEANAPLSRRASGANPLENDDEKQVNTEGDAQENAQQSAVEQETDEEDAPLSHRISAFRTAKKKKKKTTAEQTLQDDEDMLVEMLEKGQQSKSAGENAADEEILAEFTPAVMQEYSQRYSALAKQPLPSADLLELTDPTTLDKLRADRLKILESNDHSAFGDMTKAFIGKLIEGRSEPLGELATKLCAYMHEETHPPGGKLAISRELLIDRIPVFCNRKNLGVTTSVDPKTGKRFDYMKKMEKKQQLEDKTEWSLWCWEMLSVDLLPEEERKAFQLARAARANVSKRVRCLHSILMSVESGDAKTAEKERAALWKYDAADEKARLATKKQNEIEEKKRKKEEEKRAKEETKQKKEEEKKQKEEEKKQKEEEKKQKEEE